MENCVVDLAADPSFEVRWSSPARTVPARCAATGSCPCPRRRFGPTV